MLINIVEKKMNKNLDRNTAHRIFEVSKTNNMQSHEIVLRIETVYGELITKVLLTKLILIPWAKGDLDKCEVSLLAIPLN